jgi:hypothetical protein
MANRSVVDQLARGFTVRRLVLAAMIAPAVVVSAGQAEEFRIGESYIAKVFAIPDGGESPDIKLKGTTVGLVGDPAETSFGLSYRGTLEPEVAIKADAEMKLLAYLYVNCDKESPSETKGVLVGSIEIADIKEGHETYTLITTVDATAFVPLRNVECVKVGVR